MPWLPHSVSGDKNFAHPRGIMGSLAMERELYSWGDQTLVFFHEKEARDHEKGRCLVGSGCLRCSGFPLCVLALSTSSVVILVMSLWRCVRAELTMLTPEGSLGGHSKAREWEREKLALKRAREILVYGHIFHLQFLDLIIKQPFQDFRRVIFTWNVSGLETIVYVYAVYNFAVLCVCVG